MWKINLFIASCGILLMYKRLILDKLFRYNIHMHEMIENRFLSVIIKSAIWERSKQKVFWMSTEKWLFYSGHRLMASPWWWAEWVHHSCMYHIFVGSKFNTAQLQLARQNNNFSIFLIFDDQKTLLTTSLIPSYLGVPSVSQ